MSGAHHPAPGKTGIVRLLAIDYHWPGLPDRERWPIMRTLLLVVSSLALFGCIDKAARSNDDVLICKQFYAEALMRMTDLKRETFHPGDLTFEQLRTLTPRDPDWRDAQFLVLNAEWGRTNEAERIVIVCGQSRVSESGQRVHCVGYSKGETAWLAESEIAKLQLRDFTVLPKIRP
jgi:hypothetical protein